MNKKKLDRIIRYAYSHVPFYIKLLDRYKENGDDCEIGDDIIDYAKIPMIGKDDIINSEGILSSEYAHNREQDIIYSRTSGSTGKRIEIAWDKYDDNKSMLPLWIARYKYYGIHTSDKCCYFFTTGNMEATFRNEQQYETSKNTLGFSKKNLTDERLIEIYEQMQLFKPVWLNIQPSIALLLCKNIKRYGLKRIESLKYIELTGEMLLPDMVKEIKQVFGCMVANQYGCNEANSIAYECPCGKMHIMENNVYVQVVNENGWEVVDGEEGEIVITTLENHAMPFIRYKIGDMGYVKHDVNCRCGNKSPILTLTTGRVNDYIETKSGRKINSYIFVNAVDIVNAKYYGIILQFQVVQKEYDYFCVKFVLKEEIIDNGIHESMVEDLFLSSIGEEALFETEFDFEYYDELLPDDDSGKLRYFVKIEK